jgi:hypothetical protein
MEAFVKPVSLEKSAMIGTDEHEVNLFDPWLLIVSEKGQ